MKLGKTHPDDDLLTCVADDLKVAVGGVRVQADDQLEVALLRVRLSLLAHVVRRRLAEVQTAHRYFGHLRTAQLHSKQKHARIL